ncbi:MAG: bifunctional aldolase/short-chain dehydrogenase, partial [Rhodospirillaceae bacterium]|nr:bifunctional aldolase/short-chain dehydrogenase [Rhodospirillaceae bacterium]
MKNLWSDREAAKYVRRYGKQGVNADLALRVYTSRLLGGNPRLVLHGGGNTSVKTTLADIMGDPVEVICVKGSGWDLGDIEPAGLPAMHLAPLQKMIALSALSDENMVNAQRTNLLDSTSPNPSVETLLHAFLPHKFIDHTHANSVLALSDQPNGEKLCREIYGDRMGYVPYIMPGFALAKKANEVYQQNPDVEGLVLHKHGVFTFAETAKQSYERMITVCSQAEARIKQGRKKSLVSVSLLKRSAPAAAIAPILRGLTAIDGKPMSMDFRTSKSVRAYVDGKDVAKYSQLGTVTPDHVIRTKPLPLIVPAPAANDLDAWCIAASNAVDAYVSGYHAYFARNNKLAPIKKTELDPMPRIILVPGVGLFGLGNSAKAAGVSADLAETNIDVISDAVSMGGYQPIPEYDFFDIEYWSLEQAKLGKSAEKPLQRKIAVVSGGGSGIGAATARAFAAEGAAVAVLDRDAKAAEAVADTIGSSIGLGCDVTDAKAVGRAFDAICKHFGGVDIAVSNAGAAWQGRIGEVDDKVLRQSFELNFWGHQNVARAAVKVMRAQGIGGCLLFNTSKQAVNPGRDFGPYGLPKAATLFLMKQYALDYGSDGIRANAVNADRIRSGLLSDEMIKSRSKARGLSEAKYMAGNLLGREVTAKDVAQAFVDLAKADATTAATITVDGGNIEA